jgi:hypothetical protein
MSTIANLAIGSIVGLSVGGAVRRRVKVVRRAGLAYGCEFLSPLSEMEVKAALLSGDVVAADFAFEGASSGEGQAFPSVPARKLSYLSRAYILGTLVMSLWIALIYIGRRVI